MRWLCVALAFAAGSVIVVTAQAPAPLAFEVAAINQVMVNSDTTVQLLSGSRRVGMTVTDTRLAIGYMSLADLLRVAFRVKPYQISGPQWLNDLRFDVQATIPAGAKQDQVPEMLRALLAARFGLVTHLESRELPAFVLKVGKDGPKLSEAPPETNIQTSPEPDASQTPRPNVAGPSKEGRAGATGGDVVITMKSATSTMTFKPGENGKIQGDISSITMGDLAQEIGGLVGRPVFDRTGLAGTYHVTLEVPSAEIVRMMSLGPGSASASTVSGLVGPAPATAASEPSGESSIAQSLEKLGLRLESRRMPVEVVVIDDMSRTPTPN